MAASSAAASVNLVTNGNFATAAFTGWTTIPAASGSDFSVWPNCGPSGEHCAAFGGTTAGYYDAIQQTLVTTPGQGYQVAFSLYTDSSPRDFQVLWNGTQIYDNSGVGTDTWIPLSFNEVGTGSDTLTFQGYNVPSFDELTDVSVSSTPEPAYYPLVALGLLVVPVWRQRRKAA